MAVVCINGTVKPLITLFITQELVWGQLQYDRVCFYRHRYSYSLSTLVAHKQILVLYLYCKVYVFLHSCRTIMLRVEYIFRPSKSQMPKKKARSESPCHEAWAMLCCLAQSPLLSFGGFQLAHCDKISVWAGCKKFVKVYWQLALLSNRLPVHFCFSQGLSMVSSLSCCSRDLSWKTDILLQNSSKGWSQSMVISKTDHIWLGYGVESEI